MTEYDSGIYPVSICIGNVDDAVKILNKFTRVTYEPIAFNYITGYNCFTSEVIIRKSDKKFCIVVLISEDIGISSIAHEATHVSDYMWNFISEQEIGSEANAYLVGWIAQCIEKELNKLKNK